MIINYFNDLREHGIVVVQEDTCWIDTFCNYVLKNKVLSEATLERALKRTLKVLSAGQTTKDVIDLLRKFDIDYEPIDAAYQEAEKEWNQILGKLD